jgi:hypothetical protein
MENMNSNIEYDFGSEKYVKLLNEENNDLKA